LREAFRTGRRQTLFLAILVDEVSCGMVGLQCSTPESVRRCEMISVVARREQRRQRTVGTAVDRNRRVSESTTMSSACTRSRMIT
jgi:hypothetical protein